MDVILGSIKLRKFKNRVLTKILSLGGVGVRIGWWRKLNIEELLNLYSSPNARGNETKGGQIGGMCNRHVGLSGIQDFCLKS